MKIKRTLILFLLAGLPCTFTISAQSWKITSEHKQKAKEIVKQMTLDEKLDYITGYDWFSIRPVPRLGLPEIRMADGPQGVRNNTQSTMYPSGILSASTWNRELVNRLGASLGNDAKARGVAIMLGPGVNIYRAPQCGRNFEYFGEDPYLTSETAKEYIMGMQGEGVMATIKHFAANNQEWDRLDVSSDVDERTMNEIYLPSFRKAVKKAHVGAVMSSYNLLNSVHTSESQWLNIEVLRNQWGFDGILMSDWESTRSGVASVNGGLDIEMPAEKYMNKDVLKQAIANDIVKVSTIDQKVEHILQTLIAFGMLDRPLKDTTIPLDNPASHATALAVAREGVVLLKNEGNILPLKGKKIGVTGPNVSIIPTGGGSGFVTPYSTISVGEGLTALCGKRVNVFDDSKWMDNEDGNIYTDNSMSKKGFKVTYFNNRNLEGSSVLEREEKTASNDWGQGSPAEGVNSDNFSVRWTGVYKALEDGDITVTVGGDDGYRLYIDDKLVVDNWTDHGFCKEPYIFKTEAGKAYSVRYEFYDASSDAISFLHFTRANEAKLKSFIPGLDNVVVCVGFDSSTESEGRDRTFELPGTQDHLINLIASLNDNVIVVLNAGGGVNFAPWIDKVKAVVMAWYPGQEGGKAIAEILTGKTCPSGKLPITIEKRWEDNPVHDSYYDNRDVTYKRVQYTEGVFVGYRGYDKNNTTPLFPFGFGLSYSQFEYSGLKVEKVGENKVEVSFDIKNTGKIEAKEVAQVYVRDIDSSVPRPLKELKGYEKINLKKGESKRVTILLDDEAFSYFDINKHDFVVESGDFEIMVGGSSQSLPLKSVVKL